MTAQEKQQTKENQLFQSSKSETGCQRENHAECLQSYLQIREIDKK